MLRNCSPEEAYFHFIDNDVFEFLVAETNRYAKQKIDSQQLSRSSRLTKWKETNIPDMKRFCGIIMLMGLVKIPNLACYWSKVSSSMSRNWYEILLRLFHASNNETRLEGDRLRKVQPLLDLIVPIFKDTIYPQEEICIDETIISFRGHLSF
ncbi:uncharacterized protein LOC126456282 [Schistocerca serialis cubense]|uniref:uncharacterized protein LOC126456282 n=1 Tax=Schistocerca serialis cubense TaxID=2023355 RepID=UPI00214F43B0|nr:uncharacterized protein LOC126456282 [Schistocerca serialis cubense]